jgi:hypothetical protein
MRKKILAAMFAALMVFGGVACGGGEGNEDETEESGDGDD